jgi:hypothetical protein
MLAVHASAASVGAGLVGSGRGVDDGFGGVGDLVVAAAGGADVFVVTGVVAAACAVGLGAGGGVEGAEAFADGGVLGAGGADAVVGATCRGVDETTSGTRAPLLPLEVAETTGSGFLAAPACAGWHAASAIPSRGAAQSRRRFMSVPLTMRVIGP